MMKIKTMLSCLLLLTACGEDSETEENSSAVRNSQAGKLIIQPEVTPPVESNTPESFKGAFALARLAMSDPGAYRRTMEERRLFLTNSLADSLCSDNTVAGTTERSACVAAANVQESFFYGQGPSDLAKLTKNIDNRMQDIFRNADWSYMPCFDETNTSGGSYFVDVRKPEGSETKEYPAFRLVERSSVTTFPDGTSYDTGLTSYLSCKSYLDGATSASAQKTWVAYGRKDGNYYIQEGSSAGMGSLAKYSTNGNLELYFALGTRSTSIPGNFTDELTATNNSSTGLIHLKSFADSGLLELTMTGSGFNSHDCGTHIITNGTLLFISTNENHYGACSADDDGIGTPLKDSNDGNRAYDATKDNKTYCIDVSVKSSVTAFDTTTPCEDQGLTAAAFKLTSLKRSVLKSKYTGQLFSSDPDTVTEVIYVPVSGDPVGEDQEIHPFTKTSLSNNTLNTSCGSSGSESSFELNYTLSLADELTRRINAAKSSGNSDEFSEADFKEDFYGRLKSATDGKLLFSTSASAGGIKWADFDLTVTLTSGGTELASQSYVESTDHTVGAEARSVTLDLSSVSEGTVFTLKGAGTLRLGCTASSGSGYASLKLGFPRISYTSKTE